MGLFSIFKKKKPTPGTKADSKPAAQPTPPRSSWLDELANPSPELQAARAKLAQAAPPKKDETTTAKPSSQWNDLEFLQNLDAALKNSGGKTAAQVIADAEQARERSNAETGQEPVRLNATITIRRKEPEPFGEINPLPLPSACKDTRPQDPPTERQLAYIRDLGVIISPDDMENLTRIDASCIISRATGDDSKEGPTPALLSMAEKLGWQGSAYIGHDGLWCDIVSMADDRTTAALYIYAVQQYQKHKKIGDMFVDPGLGLFFAFADYAMGEPAVLKSIKGRNPQDFTEPSKETIAYKAVINFLKGINNDRWEVSVRNKDGTPSILYCNGKEWLDSDKAWPSPSGVYFLHTGMDANGNEVIALTTKDYGVKKRTTEESVETVAVTDEGIGYALTDEGTLYTLTGEKSNQQKLCEGYGPDAYVLTSDVCAVLYETDSDDEMDAAYLKVLDLKTLKSWKRKIKYTSPRGRLQYKLELDGENIKATLPDLSVHEYTMDGKNKK